MQTAATAEWPGPGLWMVHTDVGTKGIVVSGGAKASGPCPSPVTSASYTV